MESIYELLHQLKELLNPKNIIDFLTTKGLLFTYIGLIVIVFAETGHAVGFYTGLKLGPRLFTRQKSLFFRPSHLQKAHEFYEKYGGKTIIIARFVPIVRTFAPIVAGAANMSYRQFLAYNVVGGFAWVFSMILAGYFLGTVVERAFGIRLEDHIEWV